VRCLKEMVLLPLFYPEVFDRFKLTPPSGVLFYGPPGARAHTSHHIHITSKHRHTHEHSPHMAPIICASTHHFTNQIKSSHTNTPGASHCIKLASCPIE
jgi:hypothetical protein